MRASSEWRRAYDHAYSVAKISGWRMSVRYSPANKKWIVDYVSREPYSPNPRSRQIDSISQFTRLPGDSPY